MADYIYGVHPVEELLTLKTRSIQRIWVLKGSRNPTILKIVETARGNALPVLFEERKGMDRRVNGANHQGVIALCGEMTTRSLEDLLDLSGRTGEDPFFVILDRVEDPGNLGAVIRTAFAAGVHGLILPKRGTAPLGGAAFKRSSGTLDRIPIARVSNLVRAIQDLKSRGIWVIGAQSQANDSYTEIDLSGPVALVIGGEKGVRRLVEEACDRTVSIPMQEGAESLNLSVAAALMIYEVLRQRK
jgi:23S rRNA (guanosine2251-2'-O)-methyltransferase